MSDPFEHARRGDVGYFQRVELDVLEKSRDDLAGYSVLSMAGIYGHLSCCQVIYRRCPKLLYERNRSGDTAMHDAAYHGRHDIIKFLLTAKATLEEEATGNNIHGGGVVETIDEELLMMVTFGYHTALHHAAWRGHFQTAELLMEADRNKKMLRIVSTDKKTPLHLAVENRHLEIVKLLVKADPELEYSPDRNGKTPLLMAFREALSGDQRTVEIKNFLIQKQSSQCAVRTEPNGWTILHHAASEGNLSAIEEIIRSNPSCSEVLSNEKQNFLHLATKFQHENAVKFVLGLKTISNNVLNGQDINGDTPLHIATKMESVSIALSLLYDDRVEKTILNNNERNALYAIRFDYDRRRAGVLGLGEVGERELKDQSDFDLLVGALIATVSFTAGITVPGGFNSDGQNKGMAILQKKVTFVMFVAFNTIALVLSLFAVFTHFCMKRLVDKNEITLQRKVATICSIGAIFAMVVAFIMGSIAVLSPSLLLVLIVCGICSIFFVCAFYSLWRMRSQQRRSRQDNSTVRGGPSRGLHWASARGNMLKFFYRAMNPTEK